MKNLFVAIALMITTASYGQVTPAIFPAPHPKPPVSLHPCTPTVQAIPSFISCRDEINNLYYSIEIQTLMSRPLKMCQGENHIEHHTARVRISDFNGHVADNITIFNNDFTYKLGDSFTSEIFNLNLKNCISPVPNGFSIGN